MTDKKLLVFDFDGTIVETHTGFGEALKEFSEARGLPYDVDKMGIGYIDPSTYDLGWGISLAEQPALMDALLDYYFNEVVDRNRFMPTVFDGAQDTIDELSKEYDLAIVTARDRKSLQMILDHYNLNQYFPIFRSLCCARDRGYSIKPAPDALQCLIKDTSHAIQNVAVIGDTTADVNMANNAGAYSIGALWGLHPQEKLASANPTRLVKSISDLPQVLREIFSQQ